MAALTKMTAVEAKLFLRDPGAPITVIGIPVALLLVFGLMPDASKPSNDFGGHSPLASVIAPMAVTILLAMLALTLFPQHVADVLPLGATLNALRQTWVGQSPELLQLGALVAFAAIGTAVAAKVFRWE